METKVLDHNIELVERCKQGDRKAYYELYKLYSKSMYNVCMRILNHLGEAEDVLQESFIDAFGKIDDFRHESTFGAWLKKIVVNNAISQLRTRRIEWVSADENDLTEIADEDFADEGDTQQRIDEVKRGIAQLPDGYRLVLTLYLFEGYDHEEIGEILKISESTSRSQYLRAKKKLLSILKQTNYHEF